MACLAGDGFQKPWSNRTDANIVRGSLGLSQGPEKILASAIHHGSFSLEHTDSCSSILNYRSIYLYIILKTTQESLTKIVLVARSGATPLAAPSLCSSEELRKARRGGGMIRSDGVMRRALANLGLMVVGVVVALLVAEVALRVLRITYPLFMQADYYTGWSHLPGATGWWNPQSYVRINSQGLRDWEHSEKKPPNTFRVAIVGDSYAEALQVPPEQAFWSVMPKQMASCQAIHGRKVEVINFGVGNYGTAQELITLRRRVWEYSPDLVLLEFYPGNDVSDNSDKLSSDAELPKPFFHLENGKLMVDNSFRNAPTLKFRLSFEGSLLYTFLRYSRVAQVLRRLKNISRTSKVPLVHVIGSSVMPTWEIEDLNPPANNNLSDAWRLTEELVQMFWENVIHHQASFLLLIASDGLQVYPDPITRAEFQRRIGLADPFYANRRIDALAARNGFEVLDLGESFLNYSQTHHVFLHMREGLGKEGFGHWNAEGHRLAGQMLAGKLCQMLDQSRRLLRADSLTTFRTAAD
jgi:hypothetical protein